MSERVRGLAIEPLPKKNQNYTADNDDAVDAGKQNQNLVEIRHRLGYRFAHSRVVSGVCRQGAQSNHHPQNHPHNHYQRFRIPQVYCWLSHVISINR